MVWVLGPMNWLFLVALGLIPAAIVVYLLLRGRRGRSETEREFSDALRRMMAPRDIGGYPRPGGATQGATGRKQDRPDAGAPVPPVPTGARAETTDALPGRGHADTATPAAAREDDTMPAQLVQMQPPLAIPPSLAIIEGFVPGDDMLELTLDEDEVAAAEAAGVRLEVRVERSSTGHGSLITVGGTPLAFVRGAVEVRPRDVILKVEKSK